MRPQRPMGSALRLRPLGGGGGFLLGFRGLPVLSALAAVPWLELRAVKEE